jgi:hypothetical protein
MSNPSPGPTSRSPSALAVSSHPFQGEVVATVEGLELRRLTDAERQRAGSELYCLEGKTHWIPAWSFTHQAEGAESSARMLRSAASLLEGRVEDRTPTTTTDPRPGVPRPGQEQEPSR